MLKLTKTELEKEFVAWLDDLGVGPFYTDAEEFKFSEPKEFYSEFEKWIDKMWEEGRLEHAPDDLFYFQTEEYCDDEE